MERIIVFWFLVIAMILLMTIVFFLPPTLAQGAGMCGLAPLCPTGTRPICVCGRDSDGIGTQCDYLCVGADE